ncbi:arginase family protein [Pedobacter sp. PAMC26386]|nr:arginase family protein [Pedobacter sp. PAMC26386]
MKNSKLIIVEVPTNLGLIEPGRGIEPGVKYLPDWLRKHGFFDQLKSAAVYKIQPAGYAMEIDAETGVRNADKIIECANKQADLLTPLLREGYFPLIIGGDCSMLIGNALAFKELGNYGLFFLDGHTDFMLPEHSQTKAAAGMDLAITTGTGHDRLTNINGLKPYFKENEVWCAGNREFTDDYDDAVKKTSIHYYPLPMLRKNIEQCVNDFLRMTEDKNLDGFFIHLDVDVLNDDLMPAVDSRHPGGLSYDELRRILVPLLLSNKASGMELGILDPELDQEGKYTRPFVVQMRKIFQEVDWLVSS